MNPCRITGLMPLKNYHPVYLEKAVQSVIHQTSPHWRLLIIVERSDHRKFNRMLSAYLGDSRIRMIVNQGRKLSGAFNTGMKYVDTDFVAIILADDMWTSNAVQVLTEYIDGYPEVDFFHSARARIDGEGNEISPCDDSKDKVTVEAFEETSPVKHLLCWRTEKGLSVGGMDETLDSVGPDDYDFPWVMAENGAKFKAVKECLYIYRVHLDAYRLTTHLPLSVHKKELMKIFRKHGVSETVLKKKISSAEQTYLQQCIYRSKLDRFMKKLTLVKKGKDNSKSYKKIVLKVDGPSGQRGPNPL